MNSLDLHIAWMPPTRVADYYLSCLAGSVFIDFNHVDNQVYMVRISFDGHGCCNLGAHVIPLNEEDSAIFNKNMTTGNFNQSVMELMVRKAILLNQSLIWQEALIEYDLV